MRLALIANPRSGTAPEPHVLEDLLRAGGAEVSTTPIDQLDFGDTAASLRTLAAAGAPDRLVVAGGDGSIGPAALLAAELGVPLAVLPAGTANDFARIQGLPLEIEEASVIARDPGAATRHAELGLADCRPFVNAAAAGLPVFAADVAQNYKALLGGLAYAVGAVQVAAKVAPLRCTVDCDGVRFFAGKAWQVVVGATGAFGAGSGLGATDHADGRLDVVVVPAGSRLGLARRAYGMRTGKLAAQAGVAHERGTVIEVACDDTRLFNVDGELRDCDPARFVLRPGGFAVVVG